MPSSVSNFKAAYKVFSVEPLHVELSKVPGFGDAIMMPVENLNIGQNFSPKYTPTEVYGRMDPVVTYKSTSRTIDFNFSCQAHHIFDGPQGVINNIANVNLLTQLLYPVYFQHGTTINEDPTAILGAPPFFRIRYGNYIGSFNQTGDFIGEGKKGITGYITSFNHQIGDVAGNVAFGKPAKGKPYRALPREIKIRMGFEVIHDELVGWYKGKFSPNGYGNNFPYNAGIPKGAVAHNQPGQVPAAVATAAPTSATDDGPQNMKERDASPETPRNWIAEVQQQSVLDAHPHGHGSPSSLRSTSKGRA
jgi:hypothetical protein